MKPLHRPSTDDIMPGQRKTGRCTPPFYTTLLMGVSPTGKLPDTGSIRWGEPLCTGFFSTLLQACYQPCDTLVGGLERVLAEDGPLCLVVELQMHPIHREVSLPGLGSRDELAS